MTESDQELATVLDIARKCGVILVTKGTDAMPLLLVKDKRTRRSLNGIEFKKRLARAGNAA